MPRFNARDGHDKPPQNFFEAMTQNDDDAARDAERRRVMAISRAAADQAALWDLADSHLPSDIREYGTRHGLQFFIEHLWRFAFITGWRMAFLSRHFPEKDSS